MRAHGLSDSASSVQSAIQGVKADNVDSDGDGVPDWQEIIDGTNPNEPGTAKDIQDPQLGCQIGDDGLDAALLPARRSCWRVSSGAAADERWPEGVAITAALRPSPGE